MFSCSVVQQREKILTIEAIAVLGYDVLVSDIDVVW